jgi:hypothetical protein
MKKVLLVVLKFVRVGKLRKTPCTQGVTEFDRETLTVCWSD